MPESIRSFAATDRFLAEAKSDARKPGYVLIGDELFLLDRARRGATEALIDPALRDFALSDLDLAEVTIFDVLDRARTPSLMAPFQLILVRGVKALYTRGAKKEDFVADEDVAGFAGVTLCFGEEAVGGGEAADGFGH